MQQYMIHFVFIIIIFIFGIIQSLYIINSFIDKINDNNIGNIFIIFIAIVQIICIIYLSQFKETFLIFLGECAYPISLIPSTINPQKYDFSYELELDYPNGTKIIYWAANNKSNNSTNTYENPELAYGNYNNCGVAVINNKKTVLHIACPDKYKVPSGSIIDKHIHYRIVIPGNPILSDVRTLYIDC